MNVKLSAKLKRITDRVAKVSHILMKAVTNKSRTEDINVSMNDRILPITVLERVSPRRSLVATSPDERCAKKFREEEKSLMNRFADMRLESTYCKRLKTI